ncbi:hypothetical protein LINGRAHAP2_LOCUS4134 [Linum grandiflorum]
MAVTSFHVRSNSLPSTPHPIVSEVEENICRLRSSQSASTSSIFENLRNLQDVHDCVDKLFQLPLNQQALVQDQKFLNQLLDGSLRLLDFCNTANDALSQMKESVCQLQSVLRRKQGDLDQNDVKQYLTLRKAVNKSIQKALKNLKSIQSNSNENPEIVAVFRDVEAITINVFESLASFVSVSRPSGWSFVSKLKQQKKVANEQEMNEFTTVDASLETLLGNKTNKCDKVQTQLKELELCIQYLEEGTECLYRRMIKSRVALLNIFN